MPDLTVTQPPDTSTKAAADLAPGDRIASGWLPEGEAADVLLAIPYSAHRSDWVFVAYRHFGDGYPAADSFLADAVVPLEVVADASGLGYSREVDDPTPVSPARVPMHTGAVVDGGRLVRDDAVLVGPTAERSCRHLALANSIAMFDDTQFVEDDPCDQPAVYATTVLRGNEIYARTCRAHDAQFRVVEGYVGSVALP